MIGGGRRGEAVGDGFVCGFGGFVKCIMRVALQVLL